MSLTRNHRIFGLDVIRAIAILLVLCSHSTLLIFPNQNNIWLTIVRFFGTVGVDLFFVLSGYLIGNIIIVQLSKGKSKFKDFLYFWMRRWFRTLPNYYFILIINIILFYILNDEIIDSYGTFFIFFQNFAWPHPDFFTESWSLSIEEYAYIIAPLFIMGLSLLFKRIDKNKLFLYGTLTIISIITLLRFYFNIRYSVDSMQDWSQTVRKVVIYRVDSVYYGFLASYVINKYKSSIKNYRKQLLVFGFFLFTILHILIFYFDIQPATSSLFYNVFYLPLLSISLLLFFPICIYWKRGGSFTFGVTKVSILSYGLYLINYSIIMLTIQHFVNIENQTVIMKTVFLFMYWILSFTFANVLYKYFERPIMDLRESIVIKKLNS